MPSALIVMEGQVGGEWHEKEGGRLSGDPQDSIILQDFSKFPSKAIEA